MTGPGTDFDEVQDRVYVHHLAHLDVEHFSAGPGTVVNAHARVFGSEVRLGRETWIDEHATIGGGSAHDPGASLVAGHWLHMGNYSQVNIARGVHIGDEVGIGIGSRVFTHGAYLSEWEGFPVAFEGVSIGSRVWLPHAQVNPGSRIGDDVVVAAGSVVNGDIPSGAFAAGVPARVVAAHRFPVPLSPSARASALDRVSREISNLAGTTPRWDADAGTIVLDETVFDLDRRNVSGPVTSATEVARNQLRRRGIRFRVEPRDGEYEEWPHDDHR